ncbi:hypothetical protein PVT68_11280 [Microbulbifer bruguierae]|uniref:Lipoprotein n=1 Tax=Microbulbifer bruguierae TaxID=3029061 RepID=A0ABY8NA51_9GAMM|nr:hypothetical protein [Microbulbifer bruguierae]WGL15350.1 hypothetical protein PVT68_11280 [Microbulbifer bruguierae]
MYKVLSIAVAALLLASCDGEWVNTPPEDKSEYIFFDIDNAEHGWEVGFADYDSETVSPDLLSYGFEQLPPTRDDLSGLRVSGDNRSSDLFMYITKRFSGFEPNTRYELAMEIMFASNVPSGCLDASASPGEGVTIKAGATTFKPAVIDNGAGDFYMNLDKGSQVSSGSDAIAIGNFANSKTCESGDFSYEVKVLHNDDDSFFVETNDSGDLWILFGTDSGFMGTTTIYYLGGEIKATEVL